MSDYIDYGYQHDGLTHNLTYQLADIYRLINLKKNTCILDLGCGNGYLVNNLIEHNFNAYGTDASEEGIAIGNNVNPGRFFVQDLSSDQLPPQIRHLTFDTIITTEVIEHLYNPEGFLRFCRKQLPVGAELIISTPYHGYLKNLALSIFNKWDSHMNPMWLGGHIKLWSRKTLSEALRKAGFEVLVFKGSGRIPYLWKSMIIKAKCV